MSMAQRMTRSNGRWLVKHHDADRNVVTWAGEEHAVESRIHRMNGGTMEVNNDLLDGEYAGYDEGIMQSTKIRRKPRSCAHVRGQWQMHNSVRRFLQFIKDDQVSCATAWVVWDAAATEQKSWRARPIAAAESRGG